MREIQHWSWSWSRVINCDDYQRWVTISCVQRQASVDLWLTLTTVGE